MTENKGYLQRYAMLSGTYLGGFWILKFILFPLGVTVPFFIFLFIGLGCARGAHLAEVVIGAGEVGRISSRMDFHSVYVYVCCIACLSSTLYIFPFR